VRVGLLAAALALGLFARARSGRERGRAGDPQCQCGFDRAVVDDPLPSSAAPGGRMIVRSKRPSSSVRPELDSAKKKSATSASSSRTAQAARAGRSADLARAGNGRQ